MDLLKKLLATAKTTKLRVNFINFFCIYCNKNQLSSRKTNLKLNNKLPQRNFKY